MRIVRLFAVLAVAVAASLAITAATELTSRDLMSARSAVEKGRAASAKGDADRAREYFNAALKKVPNLPEAHTGLGHLAAAAKKWDEALEHYTTARDSYEKLNSQMKMAQLKSVFEQRDTARLAADSLNQQGTKGTGTGKTQLDKLNAEKLQTVADNSKLPDNRAEIVIPGEAHFYVGNALFHLDRLDEAVTAWETCVKTQPDFLPVYQNLAVAYWKKGRPADGYATLLEGEKRGLTVNAQLKADLARAAGK